MNDKNRQDQIFQFEHFFELSPDLLCIAGFDGYFKRINPAVSQLLGYTIDELKARPITDFVYPEDKIITLMSRENFSMSTPLLNFENRYVTKEGEIVWLSWTSMPVVKDQLVYGIARNITHKKKIEEDRNHHLASLTKINQDLKQLSYTTSHDLRSPVNNLLSIFSLLDTSKIDDSETLEYLEILRSATENLSRILNDSVDVLIQKDKLNVKIEKVSLTHHLEVVLHSIYSLVKNSKATINVDFSEVEEIKFNKAYLESILLNLITNSIKYARQDVPAIISIYSRKAGHRTQIIIEDNGTGFDMAQVKDKIFGLHQKFHNHDDSKGIGLYLVYNHITSLGGEINLESKINEGAKFTISFGHR